MAQKTFNKTKTTTATATTTTPPATPVKKKHGPPDPADNAPRYESLPIISVFTRADMNASRSLMEEDISLQRNLAEINERRKEIKEKLVDLAVRNKVEGFRHGRTAVYYNGEKTRWTLDRRLLLENGVTPAQIQDSMKESKPFVDLRVVDLDKGKTDEGEE